MGNKRPCPEWTYVQPFKNRNGEEYKFNDNKEDTPIAHPENAPFPDIPVEALGILTK
jgi:hypothetical protein